MNPIGANTWIWVSPPTDGRLANLAPKIASWGFDLIELPIEELDDWNPRKTAELLEGLDLGATVCAAMGPGRDLVDENPRVIESTQAYLRYCVDAVHILGGEVVAGPIYSSVGRVWLIEADERKKLVSRLAAALEPLAEYAGERGVRLALEPLNRFETSFINTTDQALEVVERVDSTALGILLDTFHMNVEEKDPGAAIRTAGSKLYHFHACGSDRGVPGRDHMDWRTIAGALVDVEYEGPVCIESFTSENETIATAAAIWRPLADSQDDIATGGLAFLREILK